VPAPLPAQQPLPMGPPMDQSEMSPELKRKLQKLGAVGESAALVTDGSQTSLQDKLQQLRAIPRSAALVTGGGAARKTRRAQKTRRRRAQKTRR